MPNIDSHQTRSTKMLVAASHPVLAGHFPGQPLVPAALLLELVTNALEVEFGRQAIAVQQFRFTRHLPPDTQFSMSFTPGPGNQVRVRCDYGAKEICRGKFLLQESASQPNPVASPETAAIPPIDSCINQLAAAALYDQLPHSGQMQLLSGLTCLDRDTASTLVTLDADNPFAVTAGISAWAGLEFAAQLLACHTVVGRNPGISSLKQAYIVAARQIRLFAKPYLPVGQKLQVITTVVVAQPQALNCEFRVGNSRDQLVMTGNFTVAYSVNAE